jgi:hypothetical protein
MLVLVLVLPPSPPSNIGLKDVFQGTETGMFLM